MKNCEDAETSTKLTAAGIKTLIDSSKRRGDKLFESLSGHSNLFVHASCRASYTLEKNIKRAQKRAAEENSISPTKAKLRNAPLFEYKNLCLICGKTCSVAQEQRYPVLRRRKIISLTSDKRDLILAKTYEVNDEQSFDIRRRLTAVEDVLEEDAKYHFNCLQSFERKGIHSQHLGRTKNIEIHQKMDEIFNYIEESDLYQFSLQELFSRMGDNAPSIETFKNLLKQHYGETIILTKFSNNKIIITFREEMAEILNDSWYGTESESKEAEELKIIKAAAGIIRRDIVAQPYELDVYPSSSKFFEKADEDVPDTLKTLLDYIIMHKKKGKLDHYKKKSTSIAHAIISATKPRSFISCVQLGLSIYLHRKFGSKLLVDVISRYGYCASYSDAVLYESSAVMQPPPPATSETGAFSQYVFDNSDVDVHTHDGHNTFHCVGGIEADTPKDNVPEIPPLEKLKTQPSAQEIADQAVIPIKYYELEADSSQALKDLQIIDINTSTINDNLLSDAIPEILWLTGKAIDTVKLPGWHGFMETHPLRVDEYYVSTIRYLPFVNLKAASKDAITTVLHYASGETIKKGQRTCFVTFDQPLYIMAREITAAYQKCPEPDTSLENVIVRLGGFHLLMSFLGAIGYIMSGSGLQELWSKVYAEKSTENMMTGKNFARAVRAHILTVQTLGSILVAELDLSDSEKENLRSLLSPENNRPFDNLMNSEELHDVCKKFVNHLDSVKTRGKTAMLWIQYFEMVILMLHFIRAERVGDFELHWTTIIRMLPYFHASGHNKYAKCAHLYVQDMLELKKNMTEDEYIKFTKKGYFTIRRSNKLFAGIWSDMTIEQTLNRLMKIIGGITRRGITESTIANWVVAMPATIEVCDSVENFVDKASESSEQHIDLRESSMKRNTEDTKILLQWFEDHPPFLYRTELISLATGVVGDEKINCWDAWNCGVKCQLQMIGNNFADVSLKRSTKVLPLSTQGSNVKVNDFVLPINSTLLYQRIIRTVHTQEELESYFAYEMAPIPQSLFDNGGMRASDTTKALTFFKTCSSAPKTGRSYVIDGDYILNRISWSASAKFEDLYESYVKYVQTNYPGYCHIVFKKHTEESFPVITTSKSLDNNKETDIIFTPDMPVTKKREKLFLNCRNKNRFVKQLVEAFDNCNINATITNNATDIVNFALNLRTNNHDNVVIVGSNPEILIFLIAFANPNKNIFYSHRSKNEDRFYSSETIQSSYPQLRNTILFLYAATGCENTSAIFKITINKALKTVLKTDSTLECWIAFFYKPSARPDEIAEAGEKFLLELYNAPKKISNLNKLRYYSFSRATVQSRKSEVNLASIPPTSGASRQHFLKVYHQIQEWLGKPVKRELWGWKIEQNKYLPVYTLDPVAPDDLLNLIYCNCKGNCGNRCTCRKAALPCSHICGNCLGTSCSNCPEFNNDTEEVGAVLAGELETC